jgi:hypothetical protein
MSYSPLPIQQTNIADAVSLVISADVAGAQAVVLAETAFDHASPMLQVTRDALASGHACAITNNGLGHGIDLNHNGNADALNVFLAGAGTGAQAAFISETAVARAVPLIQITRNAAVVAAAAHVIDIDNNGTQNSAINIAQAGSGPAINVTEAATILSGTQGVQTSGSPTALLITGAAHTTLTLSTEATDINFDLARNVEWATGALALQRFFRIQAPTMDFVGASVVDRAATLAISGGPVAGANATITQSAALFIESGQIIGPAGTAALPTYGFTTTGLGMRKGAGASIAFPISALDRMRLTSGQLEALGLGSVASPWLAQGTGGNTGFFWPSSVIAAVSANATETQRWENTGTSLNQVISTTGSPTLFLATGAAHTTLTASTEAPDVDFNLRRTVQFATGAITLQRAVLIQQPTYAAVGASVISRAATLGVEAGPAAGANVTYGVTGDEGESLSIYSEGRYLGLFNTGAANSTDHGMRLETDGGTLGTSKSDSPMVVLSAGAANPSDAGGAPRRLGFGMGTRAAAGNPTTAAMHWYFQKASALLEAGWGTEIMTLEQTGRLTVNDLQVSAAQALGGGAGATLGTIGGGGPGVAAQNEWVQIDTENGTRFVPVWA